MSSLKELLDRKAALEKEIESTRREELSNAIAKVKSLMQEYGLTVADISSKAPVRAASSAKGGKVACEITEVTGGVRGKELLGVNILLTKS